MYQLGFYNKRVIKSYFHFVVACIERRNIDLSGMTLVKMLVQPSLGIMSTGHNNSGA